MGLKCRRDVRVRVDGTYRVIQEGRSVSVEVTMRVHTSICLYLVVDRDRAVSIPRPNCVRFLFVRLDEQRSIQNKGGPTGRTAG